MDDKNQLLVWDDLNNCKRLQKRFGDYDKYKKNMGNVGGDKKPTKKAIFKLMYDLLQRHQDKLVLLEVGCGPGHFLWSFKEHVSKLIGLDYSPHMLKLAEEQLSKFNVETEFINASCWDIPLPNNAVNISLQVDVCMHIGGSWNSIKEMIRVSDKYIVFTGPSFENFSESMDKQLGKISWAVSIPLLEVELNQLINDGVIKEYRFIDRISTDIYKHKILFIEKESN